MWSTSAISIQRAMSESSGNDVESGGSVSRNYDGYEDDMKKRNAHNEMVSVRNLAHRVFYQCLCIFAAIGITLIVIVAKNPYQYTSPVASNIIGYAGATLYALLMFALLSCSRDASTRVVLIIAVTLFLGVCCGFLFALNVTLQTKSFVSEIPLS